MSTPFQRQMERKRLRAERPPTKPQEKPMTTQVVAYTPTELLTSQMTVRNWCAENIRRLLIQLKDARTNLEQAERGKFRTQPFKTAVRKCERRIDYYKKVGKAIKLGYMIVPNFEMELFAVRTKGKVPRGGVKNGRNRVHLQNGDVLPEGDGRYVSPTPFFEEDVDVVKDKEGREQRNWFSFPVEHDEELTFPVSLVKPHIVAETQRALSHKLFDQVGIARGGHVYYQQRAAHNRDPIVCGRIFDPTRSGHAVTFFVAWWFDRHML